MKNDFQLLDKYNFAPVLEAAIDMTDIEKNLKSGFRACGLFPFNENAVDYGKLLNKTKKQRKHALEVFEIEIEGKIDSTALQFFKNNYLTNLKQYTGPEEYSELYKFWTLSKSNLSALDTSSPTINFIEENIPPLILEFFKTES